jgi:seryl-tRNA synthetase
MFTEVSRSSGALTDAPRADTLRADAPHADTPHADAPHADTPHANTFEFRAENARADGADFRDMLFAAGLLIPTGVDGVYGRSAAFESVTAGINRLASSLGANDGAETLSFPPVLSRAVLDRNAYMAAFPQLPGHVVSFQGDEDDHRRLMGRLVRQEDCGCELAGTEHVLTPAACYPVYPALAARGPIAAGGAMIDICGDCFRHEPSVDPARMQSFRMREYVCIGTPAQTAAFRATWMSRAETLAATLGLDGEIALANDPFFGERAQTVAEGQRRARLKYELVLPTGPQRRPTACMSFNCHRDHFATLWGLRFADPDAGPVHTACIGFGLERMALALLSAHGLSIADWPAEIRHILFA